VKIFININTDNQAFDTGDPAFGKINRGEIKNAMEQVKESVDQLLKTNWDYPNTIRDSNGNIVGTIQIHSKKIGV